MSTTAREMQQPFESAEEIYAKALHERAAAKSARPLLGSHSAVALPIGEHSSVAITSEAEQKAEWERNTQGFIINLKYYRERIEAHKKFTTQEIIVLENLAKAGNPDKQWEFYSCLNIHAPKTSVAKREHYLQLAASQGHPRACIDLAALLSDSRRYTAQDVDLLNLGFNYAKKAVESGLDEGYAAHILGFYYKQLNRRAFKFPEGLANEFERIQWQYGQSYFWNAKAIEEGNRNAGLYFLARHCLEQSNKFSISSEKEFFKKTMFNCLLKGSEHGHTTSLALLGNAYINNVGIPEDQKATRISIGFDLLKRAQQLNNSLGYIFMAQCYMQNIGCEEKDQLKRFQLAIPLLVTGIEKFPLSYKKNPQQDPSFQLAFKLLKICYSHIMAVQSAQYQSKIANLEKVHRTKDAELEKHLAEFKAITARCQQVMQNSNRPFPAEMPNNGFAPSYMPNWMPPPTALYYYSNTISSSSSSSVNASSSSSSSSASLATASANSSANHSSINALSSLSSLRLTIPNDDLTLPEQERPSIRISNALRLLRGEEDQDSSNLLIRFRLGAPDGSIPRQKTFKRSRDGDDTLPPLEAEFVDLNGSSPEQEDQAGSEDVEFESHSPHSP